MCAFSAAKSVTVSITVYATQAIVICVLLAVFDIIEHNKAAAVQLVFDIVVLFVLHGVHSHCAK